MNEIFSILFERIEDGSLLQPGLSPQVERMTWCAEGGPEQADLIAEIPSKSLRGGFPASLQALLRCGVRVINAAAEPVWWGYLARIEVQHGALASVIDFRKVANRVAVQYWQRQAELEWQGEKTFTDWAEDPHSIAQYGVKERVLFLNSLREDQAVAARDTWLAAMSQPFAQAGTLPASNETGKDEIRVRLVCRGWWETIGWRYAHLFDGYEGFAKTGQSQHNFGRYANIDALLAQSFQTSYGPWQCGEVLVKLRQFGVCDDGVTASLCADISGNPDTSTPLASQTVLSNVISGSQWVRFVMPNPPTIQADTPYWVVLQRSGSLNTANYYNLLREDSNPYPRGQFKNWNGSSWQAFSGGNADISFYLVGCKERSERILELVNADLGGQFLSRRRLQAAPQGYTLLWRDGTLTCLEELRSLLQAGDSNGRRMLAEACADRSLLIRAEPSENNVEYIIAADGSIREPSGAAASLAVPVAGRRALLAPGWLDQSVVIWRTRWTPRSGLRALLEGEP